MDNLDALIQKAYPGWRLRGSYLVPETCEPFTIVIQRKDQMKRVKVDPVEQKIYVGTDE